MGSVTYDVRRANPSEVRDGMMRVWAQNLPVEDPEEKYRWFFEQSPDAPSAVFVLYAHEEGEPECIVGTISVGVRRFAVRGKRMRVALLADLAVNTEHRQLRHAMAMVRAAKAFALEHHGVLYGFPNHKAVGVFRRVGCAQIGTMPRYARVLRHAGYIDRLADNDHVPGWATQFFAKPSVHSVLGTAADVTRLSETGLRIASIARRYDLIWLDLDDTRIDDLFRACHHHYRIVGERSAEFVSWRFPADAGHRVAGLVDRKSGELRAYAVLRRDGTVEHIRDFFGFPDGLESLLHRLVPTLYREGATSMSVRFLGSTWVTKVLKSAGFVERAGARDIIVSSDGALSVDHVEDWFLCDGDEDA